MPGVHPIPSTSGHREVLTKAVLRAQKRLGITNAQLAGVLGVSTSTVSRMPQTPLGKPKALELALLLVRLYRSLIGIVDSDEAATRWLASRNHYLEGRPVDLIQTVTGLFQVLEYLDAMRAKV